MLFFSSQQVAGGSEAFQQTRHRELFQLAAFIQFNQPIARLRRIVQTYRKQYQQQRRKAQGVKRNPVRRRRALARNKLLLRGIPILVSRCAMALAIFRAIFANR
ncbi:MAG: hypothetical protein ACI9TB_000928 [Parasphingorhabdus sp.]|jgi:hypothetical protein